MRQHGDGISLYILAGLRAKYLELEDSAVSSAQHSISAKILGAFSRFASAAVSGCFISILANEERYPLFASESVLVRNFGSAVLSFERSFSRNYALSYTRSFFGAIDNAVRGVDWRSASEESWFVRKILHG